MACDTLAVKVLTVVGARPQFIKAAPVSKALRREHQEFLLHTGQHYDEAGLPSYGRRMPEEVNRIVADHLAALLLCPTEASLANLSREGITEHVQLVGDVMFDAFLQNLEVARKSTRVMKDLGLERNGY